VGNGDFESWARFSLKDPKLADSIKALKSSMWNGERLREELDAVAKRRFVVLSKQVHDAIQFS